MLTNKETDSERDSQDYCSGAVFSEEDKESMLRGTYYATDDEFEQIDFSLSGEPSPGWFKVIGNVLIVVGIVALILAISACSKVDTVEAEPVEDVKVYTIRFGHYVREFKLSDGTRCVAYSSDQKGGIACDWD